LDYSCSTLINGTMGKQDGSASCLANTGVPQVSTAPNLTGASAVTATFSNQAAAVLQGKSMIMTHNKDGSWACSTTLPAGYAPRGCE
ncbi:MAG: pilin, partial [Zoogloeaceae bacterium]|nr:pilin [Zoogloeaceae bacterium]